MKGIFAFLVHLQIMVFCLFSGCNDFGGHKSNKHVSIHPIKVEDEAVAGKVKVEMFSKFCFKLFTVFSAFNCHFQSPAPELVISDVKCGGQPSQCGKQQSNKKQDSDEVLTKSSVPLDLFGEGLRNAKGRI